MSTTKIEFVAVPKVFTASLKSDFEVMEAFACKEDPLSLAVFFTLKLAGAKENQTLG